MGLSQKAHMNPWTASVPPPLIRRGSSGARIERVHESTTMMMAVGKDTAAHVTPSRTGVQVGNSSAIDEPKTVELSTAHQQKGYTV